MVDFGMADEIRMPEQSAYGLMCGDRCEGIFPTLEEARSEAVARLHGMDVTWVRYAGSDAEYMFLTKALDIVAKQGRRIGQDRCFARIEPIASPLSNEVSPLFPVILP